MDKKKIIANSKKNEQFLSLIHNLHGIIDMLGTGTHITEDVHAVKNTLLEMIQDAVYGGAESSIRQLPDPERFFEVALGLVPLLKEEYSPDRRFDKQLALIILTYFSDSANKPIPNEHIQGITLFKDIKDVLSILKSILKLRGADCHVNQDACNLDSYEKIKQQTLLTILQVLSELSQNSIKYSGRSSSALTISITLSIDNKSLKIRHQDNGDGIPPEKKESVFERGVTSGKGAGIGLDGCRKSIEAEKGTLTLDNTNKQGTCFVLDIPIKKPSRSYIFDKT